MDTDTSALNASKKSTGNTSAGIDSALRSVRNDGVPLSESAIFAIKGIIMQGIGIRLQQERRTRRILENENVGLLISCASLVILMAACMIYAAKYGGGTYQESPPLRLEQGLEPTSPISPNSKSGKTLDSIKLKHQSPTVRKSVLLLASLRLFGMGLLNHV